MDPWGPLAGAIVGALLTWWFTVHREGVAKERQIARWWNAVLSEIEVCRRMADEYLAASPKVIAPAYRLPTVVYENVVPDLLGATTLPTDEVRALFDFFINVDALNRGLDIVQDMKDTAFLFSQRIGVNDLKASHIASGGKCYVAAASVLRRHIPEMPWA